jgi:hypothetical protein
VAFLAATLFLLMVAGCAWATFARGGGGRSCCAVADPAKDLRMRAAFTDDAEATSSGRRDKISPDVHGVLNHEAPHVPPQ